MPRRRIVWIDVKVGGFAHALGVRIGVGEHEPGETPGERRLADALRAADQPGVGETPVTIGRQQFRLGGRVADERLRVARMRRAGERVAVRKLLRLGPLHRRLRSSAPTGSSRALTTDQICVATLFSGRPRQ